MDANLAQLVDETIELTGTAPPAMFESDSPALRDVRADPRGFYLVGLIGGKEVGKSALVNALVGQPISRQTSFGPGTETVVAYAHESQRKALAELLDREVPGKYQIVTHAIARLGRQVLLDLPDIDSHWAEHIEITRRMLRHMLFPLWVQSVEKYADGQARELLTKVAAGNDPANFVFCLNKVDQIPPGDAKELRDDFSRRIGKTLSLPEPPQVWMVSAVRPDQFDLPGLRDLLAQQKSEEVVGRSRELAVRQQDRSLLAWLDAQRLPDRAERVKRLQEEAEELSAERIGVPLLEQSIPRILDDPGNRLALIDAVMSARVARWPILGLVHTLLNPLFALVRRNVGAASVAYQPPAEALVDAYLAPTGLPLAHTIQATFAALQQSHPAMAPLYREPKLWEAMAADAAAADLKRRLASSLERQREAIETKAAGHGAWLGPIRWLLTIGAVLWFPIVQPVLEIVLAPGWAATSARMTFLVVQLIGATYLLKSVGFLAIYFLVLWLALRWDTSRRVGRLLGRWKSATSVGPSLSLARQTMDWMDELVDPIRAHRQRLESLIARTEELRHAARPMAA